MRLTSLLQVTTYNLSQPAEPDSCQYSLNLRIEIIICKILKLWIHSACVLIYIVICQVKVIFVLMNEDQETKNSKSLQYYTHFGGYVEFKEIGTEFSIV